MSGKWEIGGAEGGGGYYSSSVRDALWQLQRQHPDIDLPASSHQRWGEWWIISITRVHRDHHGPETLNPTPLFGTD